MPTRKLALALLVPFVSALLVAGCGSSDDGGASGSGVEGTTTTSADASDTPVSSDDGASDGSDTTVPGSDASDDPDAPVAMEDAQTLIGLTQEEAEAKADDFGWIVRVVRLDGEDLAATNDYLPSRVNVEVTDGDVTDVVNIG